MESHNFSEQVDSMKQKIDTVEKSSIDKDDLRKQYDQQLWSLNILIDWANVDQDVKKQIIDQSKWVINNHLNTFLEELKAINKMEKNEIDKALQNMVQEAISLVSTLHQNLSHSMKDWWYIENADGMDFDSWKVQKGEYDKVKDQFQYLTTNNPELNEVLKKYNEGAKEGWYGPKDAMEYALRDYLMFKNDISIWDAQELEKIPWGLWSKALADKWVDIKYVSINNSEKLRDPLTNKELWKAQPWEKYQIVWDLPAKWKYEYKKVKNEQWKEFKLCMNDKGNVSDIQSFKTKATAETSTKISEQQPEKKGGLMDDIMWSISDISSKISDGTSNLAWDIKNKYNELAWEWQSENNEITQKEKDLLSDLVGKWMLTADGKITKLWAKGSIADLLWKPDTHDLNQIWIKPSDKDAATLKIPKWQFIKATETQWTYIYEKFPEFWRVQVSEWMQVSLEPTPPGEVYKEKPNEPIPTDMSQFPTDPKQLEEYAEKCPLKILTTAWKGWDHPWGHVALEIDWKIYSYWRWWKTWWAGDTKWEWALFVFNSFAEYNASEWWKVQKKAVFWTSFEERQNAKDFFVWKIKWWNTIDDHRSNQAKNWESQTKKSEYKWSKEYMIEEYDVFNQNCTTITLNALQTMWWDVWGKFKNINAEYNTWSEIVNSTLEGVSDLVALWKAATDVVSKLGLSILKLDDIKSAIQKEEIPKSLSLNITDKWVIRNTWTEHDWKNLLALAYSSLIEAYWTDTVRLPENLVQILDKWEEWFDKYSAKALIAKAKGNNETAFAKANGNKSTKVA